MELQETDQVLPLQQFLFIAEVAAEDQGAYFCTAANPAGTAVSELVELVVFGEHRGSPCTVCVGPMMCCYPVRSKWCLGGVSHRNQQS